eukprot:CAMPEP_0168590732 /NCGR_PEP_ID=MMETSP0420-20121227/6731_1 /TAXON_ID=498008 /ORGANISM="Pessonella sp." /LENGTH=108 /DNA_ID=CAMNT_0008626423 /DNA_START=342 /DNA_END=665 /DNA_ORIENTATION=-
MKAFIRGETIVRDSDKTIVKEADPENKRYLPTPVAIARGPTMTEIIAQKQKEEEHNQTEEQKKLQQMALAQLTKTEEVKEDNVPRGKKKKKSAMEELKEELARNQKRR